MQIAEWRTEPVRSMPRQKPGRSKQDYATPVSFIRAIQQRLGIEAFTFDFAADATNAKAAHYWTVVDDALRQPAIAWAARCREGWAWLNPPFGKIAPFAQRCREIRTLGGRVAFLVPAAVGANWFRDFVDGQALVLFLNGRLAFMPDTSKNYPKDCVCCLFSQTVMPGYEVWAWRSRTRGRR